MKTFQIARATAPLKRDGIHMLGDKSLAHRAMLFGALADGKSVVSNFPDSGVTRAMLNCLRELGVDVSISGSVMMVEGGGMQRFKRDCMMLNCQNSATTMRLLIGALFGTKTRAVVTGSESLRKRPVRIDKCLQQLGFTNMVSNDGHLTLYITEFKDKIPDKLPDIDTKCNSAQLKSAVILAALGLKKRLVLREPLQTRDHTEKMLMSMGASISWSQDDESGINTVCVDPLVLPLEPISGKMPGDISSAAFILAAVALVPNSEVTIEDVLLNDTRTAFIDVMRQMGCEIEMKTAGNWCGESYGSIHLKSPTILKQVDIRDPQQVVNMIDEFPVVAALMAHANGISTVRNAEELRLKESDRISSIVRAYEQLGLQFHEYDDGFSVNGSRDLKARAPIATSCDHRIAMAFSLLGLVGDVSVDDGDIISQSFPGFNETIDSLRT